MPNSADPRPVGMPDAYATGQLANVIAAVRELKAPTGIGAYFILEAIGEGGMGTVYKAEQRTPIQRIVAVKIIKPGMDSREVIARFESERQALALMNHPNVAKVLDAGATDTGRPYFVMEYVQGEPITTFADQHKLSLRQRLELFMQACDAVQHAHQKAIIHRDLKPSNILVATVDGKPQVKVIDFGVAKAVDQRLTEKTLFTQTGQLIGTPEYMSPEQTDFIAAGDVDTRSDVYSLGVILYELLTGALPFDGPTLRSLGYQEIQRVIREVDPPRPSTRLSKLGGASAREVAQSRQMTLELLASQLKSELEWIPLKAMRKERSQRYATAAEFSQDIQNYLANRPLRAGPESATYRAKKFLRRNKTGVVASAAMALLLIGGVIATTWQAVRATRAEHQTRSALAQAQEAKAAAQQVSSFLVDMLQSVDPAQAKGKPVLVRDVLDKAATGVSSKFPKQPRVEAAVRLALGRTYHALGLYAQAEPHVRGALALYRRLGGDDDPETLRAESVLGVLLHYQGKWEESLAVHQDCLARRRRALGESDVETNESRNDVAVLLMTLGKLTEAEPLYREALEHERAMFGEDAEHTLKTTGDLGQLLKTRGQYVQAEQLLRKAYDGYRRTRGIDDPDCIGMSAQLADTLRYLGRLSEAEVLWRQAVQQSRKVFNPDHFFVIGAEKGLATVLASEKRYDEAISLMRDVLERNRRLRGSEDRETLQALRNLGAMLVAAAKPAEAEPLLRESLTGLIKVGGPDHPNTILAYNSLASALEDQEKWTDALPLRKDVYERLHAPGRVQLMPTQRASALAAYAACLVHLQQFNDALEPLTEARQAMIDSGERDSSKYRAVLSGLVAANRGLNRTDDAARWSAELAAAEQRASTTNSSATRAATEPAPPH